MQNNQKIYPEILISELIAEYPEIANYLITEYDIHCVGCFASHFDTLIDGARIHGIEGKYFDQMLQDLNNYIEQIK